MGEIEDRFLHGMMMVERDNTLMTVKEFLETVEADFDRIVIQNKDGLILYYGDRSAGIPEKSRMPAQTTQTSTRIWKWLLP